MRIFSRIFYITAPSNVKYYGNAGFSIKRRLRIKYYCIKKAEMAGFLNLKAKEIYKLELITDYPRVIREQLDE